MNLTNEELDKILSWEPEFKYSTLEFEAISDLNSKEQYLLKEESRYVQLKTHYYVLYKCSKKLNALIYFLEDFNNNNDTISILEVEGINNKILSKEDARRYKELINSQMNFLKHRLHENELLISELKNDINKIQYKNSKLHYDKKTILFFP